MKSYARRLSAGTDLRRAIEEMVHHYDMAAGAVQSVDGWLSSVELNIDGDLYSARGRHSVRSVTGSVSNDRIDLKLSVKTPEGRTLTGSLVEGCIVADTVDVVVIAVERAAL